MRRIAFSVIAAIGLLLMPLPGLALDHDNLDPNRPICNLSGQRDIHALAMVLLAPGETERRAGAPHPITPGH